MRLSGLQDEKREAAHLLQARLGIACLLELFRIGTTRRRSIERNLAPELFRFEFRKMREGRLVS